LQLQHLLGLVEQHWDLEMQLLALELLPVVLAMLVLDLVGWVELMLRALVLWAMPSLAGLVLLRAALVEEVCLTRA
jgi:hypothetical protein